MSYIDKMYAQKQLRRLQTVTWEQALPDDTAEIALGLHQQSPFPVIGLYRSQRLDQLLEILSLGADLSRQRHAWDVVSDQARRQGKEIHWLKSSFDGVIAQLCFAHLRHTPCRPTWSEMLKWGRIFGPKKVIHAWTSEGVAQSHQKLRVYQLWLESHPERASLDPEVLSPGQLLMMALAYPGESWRRHVSPDLAEFLLANDLGL